MVLSVHSRRISIARQAPSGGSGEEAGVNESEAVMIVAPLQADDAEKGRCSVICPRGMSAGDTLHVACPSQFWQKVQVTVPDGISAGMLFHVALPASITERTREGDDGERKEQRVLLALLLPECTDS